MRNVSWETKKSELSFLSHTISCDDIQIDNFNYSPRMSVQKVEIYFLGLVGYFARLKQLRCKSRKTAKFEWSKYAQQSFDNERKLVS